MKSYNIQGQCILTLDFTSERTGTLYFSLKINIRLFKDWSDRTAYSAVFKAFWAPALTFKRLLLVHFRLTMPTNFVKSYQLY